MADEEKVVEAKPKSNLVLIIVIVLLVLLLVIGGVVAYLLTSSNEAPRESAPIAQNADTGRSTNYLTVGPMYPMPQFIVNLLSEGGSRFLKVTMDMELNNELLAAELEKKKPLIRDIIIRTLSSKTFEEVSTIKGKDRLKDEIAKKINEVLTDGRVKNIFFTDFVVQ